MISDITFVYPGYEGMLNYPNSVYFYYYDHRNKISYNDLFQPNTDLGPTDLGNTDLMLLIKFKSMWNKYSFAYTEAIFLNRCFSC